MPRGRKPASERITPPPAAHDEFLRQPAVVSRTGLSAPTIWRMIGRGDFPKPRKLTGRAVAWLESEIAEWIKTRPTWSPQ
jgi:prophage regulatory protein